MRARALPQGEALRSDPGRPSMARCRIQIRCQEESPETQEARLPLWGHEGDPELYFSL